jgi:SAM-dependent methyltransferase
MAQGLNNVEIVRGTYTDTKLPDGLCDVTFVLDAYHHFEWPAPMLEAMRRDTKRGGRLVVVDFYRRQNEFFDAWGIDAIKHLRLDLDGVVEEIEAHGWDHAETRTFLPLQYFAVFTVR